MTISSSRATTSLLFACMKHNMLCTHHHFFLCSLTLLPQIMINISTTLIVLIGVVLSTTTASAFTSPVYHQTTTHRSTTHIKISDDTWYETDGTVNIVPKFKIKEGMRDKFIPLLPKFVELVKANEGDSCLYYGFVSTSLYIVSDHHLFGIL